MGVELNPWSGLLERAWSGLTVRIRSGLSARARSEFGERDRRGTFGGGEDFRRCWASDTALTREGMEVVISRGEGRLPLGEAGPRGEEERPRGEEERPLGDIGTCGSGLLPEVSV
jgi:hypothetical protein